MTAPPPIVVLGCRPTWSQEGRLNGVLGRRIATAFEHFEGGWLIVTGGRTWDGIVEADSMSDELQRRGVPRKSVVTERCSLTTRGNARFSAQYLHRAGVTCIRLVSCDWHLARATALFRQERLEVLPVPATSPRPGRVAALYREAYETISARLWSAVG